MSTLAALALALLPITAALGPAVAPTPVQVQAAHTPIAQDPYPIRVQLMTLVDHGPVLAGHLVELPPATVKRVLDNSLVVLGDPRGHGNYHGYRPTGWDRVLVWLPTTAGVTKGETVVVVGTVRTVRGAQLSGELAGAGRDVLKRYGDSMLLIAERIDTPDGESLLRR